MLKNIFGRVTNISIKIHGMQSSNFNSLYIKYKRPEMIKKYISYKMEQTKTKPERLVSEKEYEELNTILADLNIEDKNMPDVEKKTVKVTSFGGRVRISALLRSYDQWIGKTIILGGWVRNIRIQGGGDFAFVELNDGSSFKGVQVVVDKNISNYESEVIKEGIGSCFQIKGIVYETKGMKQPVSLSLTVLDRNQSYG
jgi:hypothetical protein